MSLRLLSCRVRVRSNSARSSPCSVNRKRWVSWARHVEMARMRAFCSGIDELSGRDGTARGCGLDDIAYPIRGRLHAAMSSWVHGLVGDMLRHGRRRPAKAKPSARQVSSCKEHIELANRGAPMRDDREGPGAAARAS